MIKRVAFIDFSSFRYLMLGSILLVAQVARAAEPVPEDESDRQILADSKRISAWEINEVHRRFVTQCLKGLPYEVTIQYCGAVATDNGRQSQRVEETDTRIVGLPLSWYVVRDVVVFQFSVSTAKSAATISQCTIDGRTLYVSVPFVEGNRDVKAPLPALAGKSVHSVLEKMALPVPLKKE